jgi:hypothetical protein
LSLEDKLQNLYRELGSCVKGVDNSKISQLRSEIKELENQAKK